MPKTPAYRQRPGYPNALVTLTDSATGKRRDYPLGPVGSAESREAYHRVIAEWEALGRRLPSAEAPGSPSKSGAEVVSVGDIIRDYWRFARGYYQPNESGTLKTALRLLRQFFGQTPASEFGPKKLRLLREAMIRGDASASPPRRPWSRVYINQQTRRIRQMFRWAASQELLSAAVGHALGTIEPLKRGRTNAKESKVVHTVEPHILDAVRPLLNRQVRAILELQLLSGARCGELLQLRAVDITTSDPSGVWQFRPQRHKSEYRGKTRIIYLGPAAQALIRPFLMGRAVDAWLFSPAEAEAERRAEVHAARKTPLSCGNRPGTNRRSKPARVVGGCYTTPSYYRAIQRACDEAFPPAEHLRPRIAADGSRETESECASRLSPAEKAELGAWRKAHRFHPHQLRHNAGTEIRRQFGLEVAALVLGHASAQLTDAVYAERDAGRVVEVVRKIG